MNPSPLPSEKGFTMIEIFKISNTGKTITIKFPETFPTKCAIVNFRNGQIKIKPVRLGGFSITGKYNTITFPPRRHPTWPVHRKIIIEAEISEKGIYHIDLPDVLPLYEKAPEENGEVLISNLPIKVPEIPPSTLSGLNGDYYDILLPSGQTVSCIDVIEALNLNFALGEAFKAIWRMGRKPGNSPIYDAEKLVYYANRELNYLNAKVQK